MPKLFYVFIRLQVNTNFDIMCCILRGPGGERILDVVPRGTELGTQVKTGSRAGRTHSQ